MFLSTLERTGDREDLQRVHLSSRRGGIVFAIYESSPNLIQNYREIRYLGRVKYPFERDHI